MLLQAYLQTLLPRLREGAEELFLEPMKVSCRLSLLQRDVARANRLAMAQVVTSQCHLWLAQSRLPAALQSTFATLSKKFSEVILGSCKLKCDGAKDLLLSFLD